MYYAEMYNKKFIAKFIVYVKVANKDSIFEL